MTVLRPLYAPGSSLRLCLLVYSFLPVNLRWLSIMSVKESIQVRLKGTQATRQRHLPF